MLLQPIESLQLTPTTYLVEVFNTLGSPRIRNGYEHKRRPLLIKPEACDDICPGGLDHKALAVDHAFKTVFMALVKARGAFSPRRFLSAS